MEPVTRPIVRSLQNKTRCGQNGTDDRGRLERFGFGVQLVEAETGRVLWMQAGHFRAETSGHYGTAEAAMVDTIRAALNGVTIATES